MTWAKLVKWLRLVVGLSKIPGIKVESAQQKRVNAGSVSPATVTRIRDARQRPRFGDRGKT